MNRFLISSLTLGLLAVSSAAYAQAGFLNAGGQPIDTSAPIEVAADSLEVRQEEQVAVFEGNVDANQGELRLQANELQVHYQGGSGGTGGEITQLNATGNVHVSSPRETARGDWAIYDVLAEQVTMGGNVVLSQGANVIQGDRLTIDLTTGRSRIEGGVSATGSSSGDAGDGRVRGLFTIPSSDDADDAAIPPTGE